MKLEDILKSIDQDDSTSTNQSQYGASKTLTNSMGTSRSRGTFSMSTFRTLTKQKEKPIIWGTGDAAICLNPQSEVKEDLVIITKKVYCSKCKYYENEYIDMAGDYEYCHHKTNIVVKNDHKKSWKDFKRSPQELNKLNFCSNYEFKIPSWWQFWKAKHD